MKRVIHFEISAENPTRASNFYQDVFGWNITKKAAGNEDYFLIHTGPQNEKGINGGMKKRSKGNQLRAAIPTIGVPDIAEYTALVKESGGKVTEGPKAIEGTGFIAYCEDTEGNVFALLQYDSSAK